MSGHERCQNKLRSLRSSLRKKPFTELPPPTRKFVPVLIKSEFHGFTNSEVVESAHKLNEHKIKIEPVSPKRLSYNNDIIYNGYWLRNSKKKKRFSDSLPLSSPEIVSKKIRCNSAEVYKPGNRDLLSHPIKTEPLDENDIVDQQPLIRNIKTENNLATNEIGVLKTSASIRNFRRNFKFSYSHPIKQEPLENIKNEVKAKKVRSFSETCEIRHVKPTLKTNINREPIPNEIDLVKYPKIVRNFKYVPVMTCKENLNGPLINNNDPLIVNYDEDPNKTPLSSLKKSKKNREFKKKLDFGKDSSLIDFIKIEYDEENISTLNNSQNEINNCPESNSSKGTSFIIDPGVSDDNIESLSNSEDVIYLGEKKVTKINQESVLIMDDNTAEKGNFQMPSPITEVLEEKMFAFSTVSNQNSLNSLASGGELDALGTISNFEIIDIDIIEPSIKSLIESKILTTMIDNLTQDNDRPVGFQKFNTPEYHSCRDSLVPNSDDSICSSPENSILETEKPNHFLQFTQENLAAQEVPLNPTLIGIASDFLANEGNNYYSENPTENVSIKYNNFSKKMDQILLELTDEKLKPLINRNNNNNLNSMDDDAIEIELELINEVIKEDVKNGNKWSNCNFDSKTNVLNDIAKKGIVSKYDQNDDEIINFLGDLLDCDYKESADSLTTSIAHEMSSAGNPLDTNICHENVINNKDEVSETGNINNKKQLETINNDDDRRVSPESSLDTNFFQEQNLINSSEMSKTMNTINKELNRNNNETIKNVSPEQKLLNIGNTRDFTNTREEVINNSSEPLIVENTYNKEPSKAINPGNDDQIISISGNTSHISFFCDEVLNDSDEIIQSDPKEILELTNDGIKTFKYVFKEPELQNTGNNVDIRHHPELVLNKSSELLLLDNTTNKISKTALNITEKNEFKNSQVSNDDILKTSQDRSSQPISENHKILSDNEKLHNQTDLINYCNDLKNNHDDFDNETFSNFEPESFASAFACSLQSLYQFDRECVSPLISSNHNTPQSEASDDFVLTTIGDYVSPIPSDIEESFYLSPTIRELDMKPYAKYFDADKIKNAQDPELEFSKQLGKCKAIEKAINSDYRKRQELGQILPDAKWQINVINRLRIQHRKFEREAKRRQNSKTKKKYNSNDNDNDKKKVDKKSNFVEIKSTKSKAIALKKSNKIFKNQTISSIPSTSSSIRIGQSLPNPYHKTCIQVKQLCLPNNSEKIVQNSTIDDPCKTIKEELLEDVPLIKIKSLINDKNYIKSCDNIPKVNFKVPLKKTERLSSCTVKNENIKTKVPYQVSGNSDISSDTKNMTNVNSKVPNEKTDSKLPFSAKKGISSFKIPLKRPPCSSKDKKEVPPETDKTNMKTPPYSLLKTSLSTNSNNGNKLENVRRDSKTCDSKWRQNFSQKWINLKNELRLRNPGINIPGAISLLGKTSLVKRNAAFEVFAQTIGKEMTGCKSKDGPKINETVKQPSGQCDEEANSPNVLSMVNTLNKGRDFICGETNILNTQNCLKFLNNTGEQETNAIVQPTPDSNTSKLLSSLLSIRKDLLWQNCSVLLRYGDWSGNCEAKKTMMDAMAAIPVNSAAILNSVATIKSIFQSSRSENKRVAEAANTLLRKLGTVEEILPVLFMNN